MPSHPRLRVSLLEQVASIPTFTVVVLLTLLRILTTVIPRAKSKWPLLRTIAISFLQEEHAAPLPWFRARIGARPTTGESIREYCVGKGFVLETTGVKCGGGVPDATLHSFRIEKSVKNDRQSANEKERVFWYLHGGGYEDAISASGHIPLVTQLARAAHAATVVYLEYNLESTLKYPGQLVQAVAGLNILLKSYRPSQIIIGGDSAGGNLALAVIAHAMKPSPYAPAVALDAQRAEKSFLAALLISPWVHMSTEAESYTLNHSRDFITKPLVERCVGQWQPRIEVWADQLVADEGFWAKGKIPVSNVLLVVGSHETFIDDVSALARLMGATRVEESGKDSVKLFVGVDEVHDQSIVDTAVFLPARGSKAAMLRWLQDL